MHALILHLERFGGKGWGGGLIPSCPQLHLLFVALEELRIIGATKVRSYRLGLG